MKVFISVLVILFFILVAATSIATAAQQKITLDVSEPSRFMPLQQNFATTMGSGHALLGTRRDWLAQLKKVRDEIGIQQLRFHGIFDDDMSVVLPSQTPGKKFEYSFVNVFQVYDGIVSLGMRPIVELSFMPCLLARCTTCGGSNQCPTVMHYKGIVQMPANYSEWQELCYEFGKALVARYGVDEVTSWDFEVWNEMWGMASHHHVGSDYVQLWKASHAGLMQVSKRFRVGGPVTEQLYSLKEFVEQCPEASFVSSHLYPTDPEVIASKKYDAWTDYIVSRRAEIPNKNLPFLLTEFNAGLGNAELLYSSYAAAFMFRAVPRLQHKGIDLFSYWTFSDIFEENGQHANFRGFNYGIQTPSGIKKPVYRAFEQLRKASGPQDGSLGSFLVPVTDSLPLPSSESSVNAFAIFRNLTNPAEVYERLVTIFVSNFIPSNLKQHPLPTETTIQLVPPKNARAKDARTACLYGFAPNATATLIDSISANSMNAWEQMGAPAYPTQEQVDHINQLSKPRETMVTLDYDTCSITLLMTPYATYRIEMNAFLPIS